MSETKQISGDKDPLVGKVIGHGRYIVERVLGQGGMGLVYRAKHKALGKPLAIKVLRPDVSQDQEIVLRFKQEALSASEIGNEHIIDIIDFDTLEDGSAYFVMEYLDGSSLTQSIADHRQFPVRRAAHIGAQLCSALGAAHERGIVHRDLKPDNIFLIKRGSDPDFVKVLDFGIAKVAGQQAKLTRVGQVFGTPHYMSPEQCNGAALDHRTDIYALGVILFEMATGRVPFDAESLMGILSKHMYEPPIGPGQLADATSSPDLDAVILKCLAKRPEDRFESMLALRGELERLKEGRPTTLSSNQLGGMATIAVDTSDLAPPPNTALPLGSGNYTGASQVTTGSRPVEPEGKTPAATLRNVGTEVPVPLRSPGGGAGKWIAIAAAVVVLAGVGVVAFGGGKPTERATAVTPSPETVQPTTAPAAQPSSSVSAPVPNPSVAEVAPAVPAAKTPLIHLVSDPVGADVLKDGSLLGTTPLDVPRPSDGFIELVIRKSGFRDGRLTLSPVSAETLAIPLERGRGRGAAGVATTPAETPAEVPVRQPRRPTLVEETIDPWGGN